MAESQKPAAGHFRLLYFASASSYTKKAFEDLAAPSDAVKLFEELERRYPGMREKVLKSCALTINLDYVETDGSEASAIKEGDEVALIPPVSAG